MIWAVRLFVAFVLSWIAYERTDGFSLSLIESPLPLERPAQALSGASYAEIETILSQPFQYLGKGRQSFVFASHDGKWVLKFFNQKYFRNPWYASVEWPFFSKQRERELAKRAKRKDFYLNSYAIAARELKEETGIAYLHLAAETRHLPTIRITDKGGRTFEIDLNTIPFVLQKKGIPFYSVLDAAFATEGEEGLHRLLDRFLDSISLRIEKKIGDADHDVEHNWAVLGNQVFHLDPGRFYIDEELSNPQKLKSEWWRATHCLAAWLKKRYPEAELYLKGKVEDYTSTRRMEGYAPRGENGTG